MKKTKVKTWWWILGATVFLLYLLLPVDVIPDIVPIVGLLDDLGIGGLIAWYITKKS